MLLTILFLIACFFIWKKYISYASDVVTFIIMGIAILISLYLLFAYWWIIVLLAGGFILWAYIVDKKDSKEIKEEEE